MSAVRSPLGPHQKDWLVRIKAAGGRVEMEIHRNGHPTIWIPVSGGRSIRLPVRMFESLMQRDLFEEIEDFDYYENNLRRWKLVSEEKWESGSQ